MCLPRKEAPAFWGCDDIKAAVGSQERLWLSLSQRRIQRIRLCGEIT